MSATVSKQRPATSTLIRCYTCLSSGRNLKLLEDRILVEFLCPEMFMEAKPNAQYQICWECRHIIHKIKQFQARLNKAYKTIKRSLNTSGYVLLKGLSSLQTTGIETVSVISEKTPDIKEPLEVKQEPLQTVKVKIENRDQYQSGDYDELIQQTTIIQTSEDVSMDTINGNGTPHILDSFDPLLTPTKYIEMSLPAEKEIKNEPVAPTVKLKYIPQKVFINPPKKTVALRGFKEPVKVTVGITNLVKSTEIIPNLKAKEIIPNLKPKVIIPNLVKSNETVPIQNPEIVNEKNNVSRVYEETYKMLNRAEVLKLMKENRESNVYKGALYKCEKCVVTFYSQKLLDEHNKKHFTARGNSVCDLCEQRFPDDITRDNHHKMHFVVYVCMHCPYEAFDRRRLDNHIRRLHKIDDFECQQCKQVFKTFKEKRKHKLTVHYTKHVCNECGKSFLSRSILETHVAAKHRGERKECPVCKKKVIYLKSHMKSHESHEDGLYCVDCKIHFKNKYCYMNHLKKSLKHNTIENLGFKCDHCNKYFTTKRSLQDHIQYLDSSLTCNICKKEFKGKRLLSGHIRRVHQREINPKKLQMCDICGNSFSTKKSLVQHINSHLGLRPFVCQFCGATFSHSASLYTHRKLVHKVKKKSEI